MMLAYMGESVDKSRGASDVVSDVHFSQAFRSMCEHPVSRESSHIM